jgi:hypothetical protein
MPNGIIRSIRCLAVAAITFLVLCIGANADPIKIYWTNRDGKIFRADIDASHVEELVSGLQEPLRIALDEMAGKMYWIDFMTWKIQRANLDGSNVEDLVTGIIWPWSIALDIGNGKMYWTSLDKIQRANLDGSNVEDLVITVGDGPKGIALDIAGGKVYWTIYPYKIKKIQRANLDGTNVEDVLSVDRPVEVALDVAAGKMYWTEGTIDKIQRATLDGSNVEDVVSVENPEDIALDVTAGKMYWTERETFKIQRANLDGSNVEDVITDSTPLGFALQFGPKIAEPSIASLVPHCGTTRGSDRILIIGENFDATATVMFADITATQVYWLDASHLRVVTPPHTAGYVDVTITNSTGASAMLPQGFLYVPPPVIDKIFPESGSWRGGTGVTITGSNFWTGASVFFGGLRARGVQVLDTNTIHAITPAMPPSTVTVEVQNPPPTGQSSTGQATPIQFTFLPSDGHDGGCSYMPESGCSFGQFALLGLAILGLLGYGRKQRSPTREQSKAARTMR